MLEGGWGAWAAKLLLPTVLAFLLRVCVRLCCAMCYVGAFSAMCFCDHVRAACGCSHLRGLCKPAFSWPH